MQLPTHVEYPIIAIGDLHGRLKWLDKLVAKLAKEQQYAKWVYSLPGYSVDEILKPRSQLLAEPKKEATPEPVKK